MNVGESSKVASHDAADVTADELRFVLAQLPVDEHGLPDIAGISDRDLRKKFVEAERRKNMSIAFHPVVQWDSPRRWINPRPRSFPKLATSSGHLTARVRRFGDH